MPLSGRYFLRYCVVALITHSHALPKRHLCLPPSSVSSFFRPRKLLSSLLTCTYLPLLSSSHSPFFPPYILLCNPPFLQRSDLLIEYFCSPLIQLRLFNIRLSIFLTRDWIHRSPSNYLHHHLNRRPNRVRNHCRIIGPIRNGSCSKACPCSKAAHSIVHELHFEMLRFLHSFIVTN